MGQIERASLQTGDPPQIVAARYKLERLLGAGGMGSVHAAVDLSTGSVLALKRLAPDSKPHTRALFEREYQTLAELSHPNIVAVHDYGVDASGPFYTMELVAGRELRFEAPMPWRDACLCLRDVAAILGFLHARRLLHRDLSPRNLLRTPAGRLKLIDFGALASFGAKVELVGTPPFVPPEAIAGVALDQRADLFALGALGFWLLTGAHAFPARSLAELAELHEQRPPLASSLVAPLSANTNERVPEELDALIAALLSVEPHERPGSAAAVIDRLNTIANLGPDANDLSIRSYLESNVFVARDREVAHVLSALERAQAGRGNCVLIECAPGLGRTRLVRQLGVLTRLRGALTLNVDARQGQRAFAGAGVLALGLLDALPFEARAAGASMVAQLARTSEQVRARLGVSETWLHEEAVGEARIKVQLALRDWLRALSSTRTIALFVDDLHLLDEETRSLLVTLADGISDARLLVVATASSAAESSPGLTGYRGMSSTLTPEPLNSADTLELLGSMFGNVAYLERCAERLWRASAGNPAHLLELAQQLVEAKLARYVEGTWLLPAELTSAQLPATREAALEARLGRLSSDARALAESLCLPHDEPFSELTCNTVSELRADRTRAALAELEREGVLIHGSAGYTFVHPSTQRALYEELAPTRRSHAHVALGHALASEAGTDALSILRAGLHLLRGGELEQGRRLLDRATSAYRTREPEVLASLSRAAPMFEQAYLLLAARGANDHQTAPTLGILALSAYYVDRCYEARFGQLAIACYERLLKLSLARRLARFLGAKLGLLVAFFLAHLALRRQPHAASLKQTISDFATTASCLSGAATSCLAPKLSRRYADALEPFRPLGPLHTLNVVHEIAVLFAMLVEDRIALTAAGLRSMLGRIERGEVLQDMPEGRRKDCIAGLYLALGVQASWKDGTEILQIADKIEKFSPLHAMSADHFRASYYANLGDRARAEHYRQRIEVHAVQLGNTWQVELWAPVDAAKIAMRLDDPLVIRRAFQGLSRLGAELPSIVAEERRAHGMYFVLSKQYEKALPLLDTDEEPLSIIGWTFTRGALARAYNGLGQHQRAKEICLAALALRDPGDMDYPVIGLNTQIELAHAESGLGNHALSASLLDQLIEQHGPNGGPLAMGSLHEARAWTALRAGALETCRQQLTMMEAWYRPTAVATLLERVGELQRALHEAEPADQLGVSDLLRENQREAQLLTQLGARLLERVSHGLAALTQLALEIACERSRAPDGLLLLADDAGDSAFVWQGDERPPEQLERWLRTALAFANQDEQTELGDSADPAEDMLLTKFAGRTYRAFALRRELGTGDAFGILALGFDAAVKRPAAALVQLIAMRLEGKASEPAASEPASESGPGPV